MRWCCPAICSSAPPAPRKPAARSASCTRWGTPHSFSTTGSGTRSPKTPITTIWCGRWRTSPPIAGQFGVRPEDYALVGFSAGAHLCGMFRHRPDGVQKLRPAQARRAAAGLSHRQLYVRQAGLFGTSTTAREPGDDLAPGDYYYNIELNAEVTPGLPAHVPLVRPERPDPGHDLPAAAGAGAGTGALEQCGGRTQDGRIRPCAPRQRHRAPAPTRPGGCTTPWIFGKKSPADRN